MAITFLSASPAWAAPMLTVNKTDSPDPVTEGEIITYTIMVENTGDEPATNVQLTDDLPAGTVFVSAETSAGTCNTTPDSGESGTVMCDLGNIAAGTTVTTTIQVRATRVGSVENTATATSDDPLVTDEDTTRTTVLPDLVIDKQDDPDPASTEDLLLYTLRVQNQGNSIVTDIGVTDDLPLSVLDFVALDSRDFDCQITAGAVQCINGTLGPGEIGKVEIVVEPETAGTIRNTGSVFFNRTRIDSDTETTLVEDSAAAEDDDENAEDDENSNEDGDEEDDGNGNEDGDTDNGENTDDDAVGDPDDPDDVVDGTNPGGDLADTGGPLLGLMVAGLLLTGGGLLLRSTLRRG